MALIYCFGDNELADSAAKEAAEVLVAAYPNHSWWVECKSGVLVIKHFGISGTIGMVRHMSSLVGSAKSRQREIVRAAGELLERAGLPRRDYRGETVKRLELDDPRMAKHFKQPMHMKVIH